MDNVKQLDDLHEALASTESELRDAREALARVEAERDQWQTAYWKQHRITGEAQTQLAEALRLLQTVANTLGRPVPYPHIKAFLARHAQAEQQEALSDAELMDVAMSVGAGNKAARRAHERGVAELPDRLAPRQQEDRCVQDEPANFGQELEAFEKWRHTQADSLRRCGYPDGADAFIRLGSVQWAGWQARAALATQPDTTQFAAAADYLQKKADEYATKHGWDDMGGLSFGTGTRGVAKMEYFGLLEELAEELRNLSAVRGAEHDQ